MTGLFLLTIQAAEQVDQYKKSTGIIGGSAERKEDLAERTCQSHAAKGGLPWGIAGL